LPLLAVSFIQFVSPTTQLVLAMTVLGQALPPGAVGAFACVWAAVLIFVADAAGQVRARRRKLSRDAERSAVPALPCRVAAKR
ncbi:MAG: hypothetical protein C0501_00865, partial [Isosphaera sp.]|nr:hypothetical protein [Isosphaera sp.]